MAARRVPALALPVGPGAGVLFLGYEHRTPLLTITTGRPALLVTLTLPEHLEAGHVDFARQLACQAWAYAVAVERRYRGLPALLGQPLRTCWQPGPTRGPVTRPGRTRPPMTGRRRRHDGDSGGPVRRGRHDHGQPYVRLTAGTTFTAPPTPTPHPS